MYKHHSYAVDANRKASAKRYGELGKASAKEKENSS